MYLEECDVEEQCSLLGWAALQKTKLGWMQIFGVGGGGWGGGGGGGGILAQKT